MALHDVRDKATRRRARPGQIRKQDALRGYQKRIHVFRRRAGLSERYASDGFEPSFGF